MYTDATAHYELHTRGAGLRKTEIRVLKYFYKPCTRTGVGGRAAGVSVGRVRVGKSRCQPQVHNIKAMMNNDDIIM